MNEQQKFWADDYAQEYIRKNSNFDAKLGAEGWSKMLASAETIDSILECGCDIGRNIQFLNAINPSATKSVIEISKPAFDFVTTHFDLEHAFNGPIVDSKFPVAFDLVFTMGVLIHVHPDDLLENMKAMFDHSNRYVLMGE